MASGGKPYSIRRVVSWGDCDPAGIIYTPRVFDYILEAVETWYVEVVGVSWKDLNWKMDLGVPMVRAECDFMRPPGPGVDLRIEVRVGRVGRSSITFLVDGRDGDGEPYFRATMVGVFIARPAFESTPIPDDFRERIIAYQTACGDT